MMCTLLLQMGYNPAQHLELAGSVALSEDREDLGPEPLDAFGISSQVLHQIPPLFSAWCAYQAIEAASPFPTNIFVLDTVIL